MLHFSAYKGEFATQELYTKRMRDSFKDCNRNTPKRTRCDFAKGTLYMESSFQLPYGPTVVNERFRRKSMKRML